MNFLTLSIRFIENLIPVVSAVYIFVGIKIFSNKQRDNVHYFSLLMFACAIYSFGYFLEINSLNSETAFLVRNFEYFGTAFIPSTAVLFIMQITKIVKIKTTIKATLYSFSAILWLLHLTNSSHKIFYKSIEFVVGAYGGAMVTAKGPGYYALLAFYGVMGILSTILLFKAYKRADKKNTKNSFQFLLITFQIPWLVVLYIVVGYDKYVDITPFAIMVVCGFFAINEVKNDMFELQINRWENAYRSIKEPTILMDKEGRVVCSNVAANSFFAELGKSIKDIISDLNESEKNKKPIFFTIGEKTKWLDVHKNNFDTKKELTNYWLSDITNEKNASLVAESFFNAVEDFVFIVTADGEILFVNNQVRKRLNYSDEEIKQMHILDFNPKEQREEAQIIFSKMLRNEEKLCTLPLQTKNGQNIPVETRVWLGDWNGKPVVYGMSRDISLLKETENKFQKSFLKNPAIMALSDLHNHKYIDVNDAFVRKLGYAKEEIVGKTASELRIFHKQEQSREAQILLANKGKFSDFEVEVCAKDGSILTGLFSGEIIQTENSAQLITVMIDITENKQRQKEVEFLSYHDQLTGLYNRRYFEQAIQNLDNDEYFPLILIMVDVNGLKLTNDAFGHKTGDLLLEKVAAILKRECRTDDIVARIGGDEFVLLLPKSDEQNANKMIERINNAIANEKLDNIILSISVGFSVKQDHSDEMDEVFMKAEDNMYKHKLSESLSMRSKTIDLIMNSLYEKNNREMLHSKRVSEICEAIAQNMDFNKDEVNQIRIAGLMHDIGKIGIEDKILNKPHKLDHYEWNEIERHSEIGYRILSSVNEFSKIADYVLEHHEKWNGEGYPKRLKGEEISLQARIIAVADAFDAMTSDRAYRNAINEDDAIKEIKRYSGIQFDPNIAKLLVEKVLKKEW